MKCELTGDWVDECEDYDGECEDYDGDCEEVDCKLHPDHTDKRVTERLAKWRSSEFADDVRKRMQSVFQLDEATVTARLDKVLTDMQEYAISAMRSVVEEAVKAHISKGIKDAAGSMVKEMFDEAIVKRVMQIDEGKALTTTVQEIATKAVLKRVENLSLEKRRNHSDSGTLTSVIEKIVEERVTEALKELTTEAIEKFNKATMKKMMAGMAAAIGNDKRLLAVMTD